MSEELKGFVVYLCYGVVGIGIFSGTLKYINSLVFVRKHFEGIIVSDRFEKALRKNFKSFVFSDEFLGSISEEELSERWKKITYFKYKRKFPILWSKMNLKKHLENYFFEEHNLDYFYRGLRVRYDICMNEKEHLSIVQMTDFTVVTNSKDKIELKFWVSNNEHNPSEPTVNMDKTLIDGVSLTELKANNQYSFNSVKEGDRKKLVFNLAGKKEYQVEQVIDMTQSYKTDRVSSFESSKIIDDIYIEINCSGNLKYFFEPINNNVFSKDKLRENGYKNKDIIMPGELFMIFLDKK